MNIPKYMNIREIANTGLITEYRLRKLCSEKAEFRCFRVSDNGAYKIDFEDFCRWLNEKAEKHEALK